MSKYRKMFENVVGDITEAKAEHDFAKGDQVTVPYKQELKDGGHEVKHMRAKVKRVTKTHVHVEPTGAGIPGTWTYHHSEVKRGKD